MAQADLGAVMRRALELAARGPARGVNPRVGCIVLSPAGEPLAEGWHRGAGTPHAEIDALSKLTPGQASGATVVVTLEPCNHTGRTGPCSEALIAAGVARVVYAVDDPGHASRGGAQTLRAAGVEVVAGVEADVAGRFLDDWLTAARLGRPRVTLKWASSLDGRIAAADGTSRWITGAEARRHVHRQRADSDAVLTATGTVLADDPVLTARDDDGAPLDRQPAPFVVGERAVPVDAAVRRHPVPPVFLHGHDLRAALLEMRERGIRTAYVEGGPTIASALLREGLVDELHVYLAVTLLGGSRTVTGDLGVATITDQRRLELRSLERLGDDVLIVAGVPWATTLNDVAAPRTLRTASREASADLPPRPDTQGA